MNTPLTGHSTKLSWTLTASDIRVSVEHGTHERGSTSGYTSDKYDWPVQILVLHKQLGSVTTALKVNQTAQVPDDEQNAERPEQDGPDIATSKLSSQHWQNAFSHTVWPQKRLSKIFVFAVVEKIRR